MANEMYAIISVMLVSAVSLIGILFFHKVAAPEKTDVKYPAMAFNKKRYGKILPILVAFSVGGLFGDAFIHLLPTAFERMGENLGTSLDICAGLLFFFALEKFVRWQHCHKLEYDYAECSLESAATMALIGDGVHNLIDGMLIGASYGVSTNIGIATTIAVLLHEIPQEIGDFGVLLNSGYSVKKALIFNFLTGITAVVGVIISLVVGPRVEGYAITLLPFTAGGFIYVAGSDLIPELHHDIKLKDSVLQLISIMFGILVMALLTLLE